MLINNKEEFEEFYPYSKDQISKYPSEYPCLCSWSNEGGGLMGEYKQVRVIYFPKNVTVEEAFLLGIKKQWLEL
jgi:hypothetical protein